MEYKTAKQQTSPAKFISTVRVGNWSEELSLEETKLKQFLQLQARGELKIDKWYQRMSIALHQIPLPNKPETPYVKLKDVVQLCHAWTLATLACDVEDTGTSFGEFSCAVTAVPSTSNTSGVAVVRNTFQLLAYQPEFETAFDTFYDDDFLHYGQKVRLRANPAVVSGKPVQDQPQALYLYSKPVSTTHAAKHSHHQYVGLTSAETYDSVWQVLCSDPAQRSTSEGLEVTAGAPIVFQHCPTKQNLCLEGLTYSNDFGKELEVSAFTSLRHGQRSVCELDTQGIVTVAVDKLHEAPNDWAIVCPYYEQPNSLEYGGERHEDPTHQHAPYSNTGAGSHEDPN